MNRVPNGGPKWHPMPAAWEYDADIAGLPDSTQLLFLKLISLAHVHGTAVLTWAQVQSVARSVTRGRQGVDRLLSRGCLVVDVPEASVAAETASVVPGHAPVVIANAARWLLVVKPSSSMSAGQEPNGDANVPRGRARVKKERETEREPIRSPSGSDRIGSARAAPRGAGGAARPAPDAASPAGGSVGDDAEPTMSRADAIAAAKAAIRKGQANSPHCTGRDTVFSRYDPNRPIVPLTSGFTLNGDDE